MIHLMKIKLRSIFFIFAFSLLFSYTFGFKSIANPIIIDVPSLGGIVPKNDTPCSITNANVIVDINATNLINNNNINFSFRGNYTIFNPNEAINITIAAPFSRMDIEPYSLCNIKLNGSIIPYDIIDFRMIHSDLWISYFDDLMYDLMLLICNITIPDNASIFLEYAFDANFNTDLDNLNELWIYYYVGTSRAWEGNITESVEFKVHGNPPDEFYNHRCTVSELLDGNSYLWEWEDETIDENSVYIVYYGNYSYNSYMGIGGIFSFIGIICLIAIIYVIIRYLDHYN